MVPTGTRLMHNGIEIYDPGRELAATSPPEHTPQLATRNYTPEL